MIPQLSLCDQQGRRVFYFLCIIFLIVDHFYILNLGRQVDEGITWFKVIYPRVKSSAWPEEFKPVCFIFIKPNQYF